MGVLIEGMESPFLYLRVLVGKNEISKREHSFLSIPLKIQIFIPLKIERNRREWNTPQISFSIFSIPLTVLFRLIDLCSYEEEECF